MSVVLSEHLPLLASAPEGIQKLRGLILELAVRGKLVPQDPDDEPASELLKRISLERARLEVSTPRKKGGQTPHVRESERPFALPDGWEWSRIGELSSVVRGVSYDKSQSSENQLYGYLPLLRGHNINQHLKFDDLVFVPEKLVSNEQRIRRGDIVIAMSSGSAHLVGKAAQAENDINFGFGAFCGLIRSHSTELHPYFGFFFQTPQYRNRVAGHGKGIGINNLQKGALLDLECPIPPLAEQHRIVAKVDELMALCDRLEAEQADADAAHAKLVNTLLGTLTQSTDAADLAANWQRLAEHFDTLFTTEASLDALKQTILQLAVMGKLVPQDPNDEPASELLKRIAKERVRLEAEGVCKKPKAMPPIEKNDGPFELPSGWAWARFPEIGLFGRGKSKHRPRNDPALFNPGIYPLVQTGEVARAGTIIREFHSRYSETGLNQSKMWPQGTLCITIAANIADSAILGFEACFPDSVVGFIPSPFLGGSRYFLSFMKTVREELLRFAPSTAQKNINLEILESVRIPLPPKAEMERIVAKVDELMALCDRLKSDLAESRARQARLSATLIETALRAT